MQEYRDAAGVDEGMTGVSTRFAFKVLSETFNHDTEEVAADPVHLMYVLEQAIKREQFPEEVEKRYLEFIKSELWRRVMPSSSATRSRKPTSNPIPNTARTCSTVTSPMPMRGSRSRTSRTPIPAKLLEPRDPRRRAPRSKSRPASPTPRTSATRWSSSPAGAGQQQRRQPVLDELRKAARGHREADVQPGRGTAAGDQLRRPRRTRRPIPSKHGEFVDRMVAIAATPSVRSGGWSNGTCGSTRPAERSADARRTMAISIDRRLNPKDKSLGNRQRFVAGPDQIKEAVVNRIDQGPRHHRHRQSARWPVSIPANGIREPHFRHAPAAAFTSGFCPATRSSCAGRPHRPAAVRAVAARAASRPVTGRGRGRLQFVLSREEFLDIFFEDLELPDLVKTQPEGDQTTYQAASRRLYRRLARRPTSTSCAPCATPFGRRLALKRPVCAKYEADAQIKLRSRRSKDLRRPRGPAPPGLALTSSKRWMRERRRRIRLHRPDRPALQPISSRSRSPTPVR